MSGYTMTQTELKYSYDSAATPSVVSASAVTITATYPACTVPGDMLTRLGTLSSSLKFRMGGLLTATATIPTWNFGLFTGTTNAFATTNTLATTGTFTPTAATNVWWHMDLNITLRAIALGAASTVSCHGFMHCSAFPSPFFVSFPAAGAYTPFAAWATDLEYYLWPALTLGAATAGNQVTVQYMKLYGEN
jgi:hypothetical protein